MPKKTEITSPTTTKPPNADQVLVLAMQLINEYDAYFARIFPLSYYSAGGEGQRLNTMREGVLKHCENLLQKTPEKTEP